METAETLATMETVVIQATVVTVEALILMLAHNITDELVWQYDETAFSSEFYDRNGNGPALQNHITQDSLPSMSLTDIRRQGALMYTTPFRHADGHGDGPGINPNDPTTENGRRW